MPLSRGGRRSRSGRKKIYSEPTITIRVPASRAGDVRQYLAAQAQSDLPELIRLVSEFSARAPFHLPPGQRGAWRHACYLLQEIRTRLGLPPPSR